MHPHLFHGKHGYQGKGTKEFWTKDRVRILIMLFIASILPPGKWFFASFGNHKPSEITVVLYHQIKCGTWASLPF